MKHAEESVLELPVYQCVDHKCVCVPACDVCVVAVCVPRVSEPGELRQEYEDQVSRVSSVSCACSVFLRKNRFVHFKVLNVSSKILF